MIDPWQLPGPLRVVSSIVMGVLEGYQFALFCEAAEEGPPVGLRQALVAALADRQLRLTTVFDQSEGKPLRILAQAVTEGFSAVEELPPGLYWVDGITEARRAVWAETITAMADRERNRPLLGRVQLLLPFPPGPDLPHGLGLERLRLDALGPLDLEVAVCYALSGRTEPYAFLRLRAALAVILAATQLPSFRALDALQRWLDLPDEALVSPEALSSAAALTGEGGLTPDRSKLFLWRAQQTVLLGEIDCARMNIIEAHPACWEIPYTHPAVEGRPAKTVMDVSGLELTHLFSQAHHAGLSKDHPIRRRLQMLRVARNALSHMDTLGFAEIAAILSNSAWRK